MMRNDIKPVLSYFNLVPRALFPGFGDEVGHTFMFFTFNLINLPRGLKAIGEKGEFRR